MKKEVREAIKEHRDKQMEDFMKLKEKRPFPDRIEFDLERIDGYHGLPGYIIGHLRTLLAYLFGNLNYRKLVSIEKFRAKKEYDCNSCNLKIYIDEEYVKMAYTTDWKKFFSER